MFREQIRAGRNGLFVGLAATSNLITARRYDVEMNAIQPHSCPRCRRALRPIRVVTNPDYPHELQVIFECKGCHLSLTSKDATRAEVFAAAAH